MRLLAPEGRPAWRTLCEERELPVEVIEAVIAHPERAVRAGFARNRHVDPAQRGRLVEDPDSFVRAALAGGPRGAVTRPRPLPDDVLERLMTGQDAPGPGFTVTAAEIAQELEASGQIPQSFRRAMPTHHNSRLRAQAAGLWLFLTPGQRQALLADPDPAVRAQAEDHNRMLDPHAVEADLPERDCHYRSMLLVNYAISATVAERCLAERRDLWALAHNPNTPYEFVERLANDPDPAVRERVASRCDLQPGLLASLAEDPDDRVRTRALLHTPPRTEPQRRMIDTVIGRTADQIGHVRERIDPPSADWFAACAVSGHPLLRRVAATYPQLPVDLADRLARDPDLHVRHLLAYNHPFAPPQLLLEAFIAGPRQRSYLLTDPRLPRTGLADLLDHADPEVRTLAAADTTLPQPPLAQLADPDPRVRDAAAANPLLPAGRLDALLSDPEHARAAARNPRLEPERLHDLLDQARVPRELSN
jgi:hypothetical protein